MKTETETPKIKERPIRKLDMKFDEVGACLYRDLREMGEQTRLEKGMLSNWAVGAIREAAETFIVRQMVLDELNANPGQTKGMFATRGQAMKAEVERVTTGITKAILAEAVKASVPVTRKEQTV